MADIYSGKKRSDIMSTVRSRDTRPEMVVRKRLHARGFRFRLHRSDLPGSPDLVLPRYRAAVFVHGCFWHRHPGCRRATLPSTRSEWWQSKLSKNVERDKKAIARLRDMGWNVHVLWECEIRRDVEALVRALASRLNSCDGEVGR
jgi:DNA mismatch endonuclease, patch repair protein